MKCRCGHGRQTHRRRYGKKRQPCWAPISRDYRYGDGKRDRTVCTCRDFVKAEEG